MINVQIPGWQVLDIAPDVTILRDRDRPTLPACVEQAVAACWAAAQAALPALFNGEVFSVDQVTAGNIRGHWTEYRRIVAQLRRPDLEPMLRVQPLAAAGLIEGPDGIVFGRRPADAVYQPGLWQLAPAGNVDRSADGGGRVNIEATLLAELREELGLQPHWVQQPRPLCIVRHPGIGVMDLCLALATTLDKAAIHRAHEQHGDGEYPEIAVVPRPALDSFLASQGAAVAPQVLPFLERHLRRAPG